MANKADLVRNREIKSNTAKKLAMKYGVKYIETSPGNKECQEQKQAFDLRLNLGINHNIDELLVGIFKQIDLRQKCTSRNGNSLHKVRN